MFKLNTKAFIFGCLFAQSALLQAAQSLTEIDDILNQYVHQALNEQYSDQGDFVINIGKLDPRLQLEQCSESLKPEIEFGNLNQSNFTVKVTCPAPKKWAVRVPVKVQLFKQVAVTATQLLKDHQITASDLQMTRQDVSLVSDGYFQSVDELIGMAVQKPISPGTIIKHHMVKPPTLVHRGEIVKIVIKSPGLTIEGMGIAQNDGAKGEMVKVKNNRSNRVVDAMVTEPGITVIPL